MALIFAILFTSIASALPLDEGAEDMHVSEWAFVAGENGYEFAHYYDEYSFDPDFGATDDEGYTFYPGEQFDFDIAFHLDDLDVLRQLPFDEFGEIAPFSGTLSHAFLDPVIAMIPGVVVDPSDPLLAIEEVMLVLFDVLTQQAPNGYTNFYNAIYDALFTELRAELIAIRAEIDQLLGTGSSAARNNRLVNNINARLNGLPTRIINGVLNEIMDDVFGAIDSYHPGLLGRPGMIFDNGTYTFPYVRTRLNAEFHYMLNGSDLLGAGHTPQTIRDRLLTVTGSGTGMQVTRASLGGALADYVFAIVNYQQPRPHRPTRSYSVAQRRARLAALHNNLSSASINQGLNRSMTGWIMSRLDIQPFVVSSWVELRAAIDNQDVVPRDGTPVTLYIASPNGESGIEGVPNTIANDHTTWVNGRQGFTTTGTNTMGTISAGIAGGANTIVFHANQNVTLRNYRFDPDNPAVILQNSNAAAEGSRRHFNLAAANTFLTLDNVILKRFGTTTAGAATCRFFGGGVNGLPTGVAAVAREDNPATRRVHFDNGGRIMLGTVTAWSQLAPATVAAGNPGTVPGANTALSRVPINGVPVSIGIGGMIGGLTSPATWTAASTANITQPGGADLALNGTRGIQSATNQEQIRLPAGGRHIVLTSADPNVEWDGRSRLLHNSTASSRRRTINMYDAWARLTLENVILDSTTHPGRVIGGISVPAANGRLDLLHGATISRISTGDSGAIQNTGNSVVNMFSGAEIVNNRAGAGAAGIIVGNVSGHTGTATFNMHGGLIAYNINRYAMTAADVNNDDHRGLGGGVLVGQGNNTFNMFGGEIRDNQARFTNLTGAGAAAVNTRRSSSSGGGVAIDGDSTFNWYGGRIHSNAANNGGVIAIIGSAGRTATVNVNLQDWGTPEWAHLDQIDNEFPYTPVFSGSHVPGAGGFLVMTNAGTGRLNFEGGAIIRGNSAGTVRETRDFVGNTPTLAQMVDVPGQVGGAIALTGSGTLIIDGVTMQSNEARNAGGGVAVDGTGTIRLETDTMIEQNRAGLSHWELQGGVVVPYAGGERIVNAGANGGGAAITLTTGSLVIASNAIIRSNTAQEHGGGLYSASHDPIVLDETMQIYGNTAQNGNGGGIYTGANGNLTMIYGSIHNNHAPNGNGGAIYRGGGGALNLNGGVIRANSAHDGGGVFFDSSTHIPFTMGQLINVDGRATIGTPAAAGRSEKEDIFGITIEHNEATRGGGVFVNRGSFAMNNGAIISNRAVTGGGVYFASLTPVQARFTSSFVFRSGTPAINIPMPITRPGLAVMPAGNLPTGTTGGNVTSRTIPVGTILSAAQMEAMAGLPDANWLGALANQAHYGPNFTMAGQTVMLGNLPHPGGTIARNEALGAGGGVWFNPASPDVGEFNMQNGIINDNVSGDSGGGLYVGGNSNFNLTGGSVGSEVTRIIFGAMDDPIPYDAQLIYTRDPDTGAFLFVHPGTGAPIVGPPMQDGHGNWIREFERDLSGNIIFDSVTGEPLLGDYTIASFTHEIFSGNMAGFQFDVNGEPVEVNPDARGGGVYFNSSGTFHLTGTNPADPSDPGGAVENNISTGHGGGVYVTDVSPTTEFNLVRGTFRNNHAINGSGGGIFMGVGNLLVGEHINIVANSAGESGGGVFFASGGTIGIEDGGISSNIAGNHGGGVYIANDVDFHMTGGTIGGEREVPTVLGTTFLADIRERWDTINEDTDYEEDVPVFVVTSEISYTIEDLLFGGNMAGFLTEVVEIDGLTERRIFNSANTEASGGGLYFGETATFHMLGGSIENNIARGSGGGVFIPTTVTMEQMTDADINFNRAGFAVRDGAPYGAGSARDAVCGDINCRDHACGDRLIVPSNPDGHGGGIFFQPMAGVGAAGSFTMDNSSISYNVAHGHGGSLWINRVSEFYMQGRSAINGNETITGNGGGVFFVPAGGGTGTFHMVSGTIDGNRARSDEAGYGKGGGVYIGENTVLLIPANNERRTLNHNEARLGGGIFVASGGVLDIEDNTAADMQPDNIQINHNRALEHGGGVYLAYDNDFSMRHGITISYNVALGGSGGGLYFAPNSESTFTITGGQINGNMAYSHGGGVFIPAGVNLIQNTIGSEAPLHDPERRTEINGNRAGFTLMTPAAGVQLTEEVIGEIDGFDITRRLFETFIDIADIIVGDENAKGGGIYLASTDADSSGTFVISNSSISGNATAYHGGGIWIDRNLHFEVEANASISGNTAGLHLDGESILNPEADGGGVYFTTVGAAPSTFHMASGAGIGTDDEPVIIEREIVEDVTTIIPGRPSRPAIGNRPAQDARQRQIIVDRVTTTTREAVGGNQAARHGGGVYFGPAGNGVFEMEGGLDTTLFGNEAMLGHGGGLHFAPRGAGESLFHMESGTIGDETAAVRTVIPHTTNRQIFVNRGPVAPGNPAFPPAEAYNWTEVHADIALGVTDEPTITTELCRRNIADNGGGVYFYPAGETSVFRISDDAAIAHNAARIVAGGGQGTTEIAGSGGGLYMNIGILEMIGGHIHGNIAEIDGGGVFVAASAVIYDNRITDVSISDNMAGFVLDNGDPVRSDHGGDGGGLYFETPADEGGDPLPAAEITLIIDEASEISGNIAGQDGGGIWLDRYEGLAFYHDTKVNENEAGRHGGGLYFAPVGGGAFTISDDVQISGNEAEYYGGGVLLRSVEFTMNDGTIGGNTALLGGGIYLDDTEAAMYGGVIGGAIGNAAVIGGGVYLAEDSLFTMDAGTSEGIIGNNAAEYGGGIYVESDAAFVMLGGGVRDNTAEVHGGGIYVAGELTAETGEISGNQAVTGEGGGIFTEDYEYVSPLSIDGAGAALHYRNLTISGVTFANNSAATQPAPPINAAATGIPAGSQSVSTHPLNNYDINFLMDYLFLQFFKTNMEIYDDNLAEARFLPGALFHLYCYDSDVLIETQASDSDGFVAFDHAFTLGGQYRLVEQEAPTGFFPSDGYWIITVSTSGTMVISEQDGNFPFLNIGGVLHVGNEPATVPFVFHKTDERLYSEVSQGENANWGTINTFLRAGAHFSLFRWNGAGTPLDAIISPDDIGSGSDQWTLVWYGESSNSASNPMMVDLDTQYTYFQLVETQAPTGFELPWGQWRLTLSDGSLANVDGWYLLAEGFYLNIRAIGDLSIPAFARNPETGEWYVGNRPILILPALGGILLRDMFLFGGTLVILLALGLLAYRVKRGGYTRIDGAEGTCASCTHGTCLGAGKVFCMRRGITPESGVCRKFSPILATCEG